jgi:hypothetical protein
MAKGWTTYYILPDYASEFIRDSACNGLLLFIRPVDLFRRRKQDFNQETVIQPDGLYT